MHRLTLMFAFLVPLVGGLVQGAFADHSDSVPTANLTGERVESAQEASQTVQQTLADSPSPAEAGNTDTQSKAGVVDIVCKDKNNSAVDWFVLYKLPKSLDGGTLSSQSSSYYTYVSSESPTVVTNTGFDGQNGPPPLSNTLAALTETSVTYVMYSDQPPEGPNAPSSSGHSKGVAAQGNRKGFLLLHTLPRFPPPPGTSGGSIKWAQDNGQLFVCVSFNADIQWNNVVNHVQNLQPYIYSKKNWRPNLPSPTSEDYKLILLRSIRGVTFDLFSKEERKGSSAKDIYESILGAYYGVSLDVQTWRNGAGGKLDSVCIGARKVRNIKALRLADGTRNQAEWRATKDHSKWAVSHASDRTQVFCASDLNRMESQKGRRGGAVCFKTPTIVQHFRGMIREVEDCK